METKPLTRERIIWHLSVPVCEIMSGVRTHIRHLGLCEVWKLCYALRCRTPDELPAVMWKLIKQHNRKDSTWQNLKLGSKDGS
jgi:hypothetical protein